MLPELIRRFSNSGRHRFYRCNVVLCSIVYNADTGLPLSLHRSLLHSTSHAGVQGLLIQGIKNEVDCALKVRAT